MKFAQLAMALFLVLSSESHAGSFTKIELPEADIFVARPVDIWSPDKDHQVKSLDSFKEKAVSYRYDTPDGKSHMRGSPLLFQSISDHPVTQNAAKLLADAGINLAANSAYRFDIYPPAVIEPKDYTKLVKYQNHMFTKFVIAQGDPEMLQSQIATRKFVAGALSVAATIFVADKLGNVIGSNLATNSVLNSSLPSDVYEFGVKQRRAVGTVQLEEMDTSQYTEIDVRKVQSYPEMLGQIIIAYKTQKTEEIETMAVVRSILVLAGVGSSPAEVEQARSNDYASRLAIWNRWCTTSPEGKCLSK